MRSGQEYVDSLKDGRQVYLDGALVDDVTTHPAFANQVRRMAELYDRALEDDGGECTFVDEETGARHSNMWLIPRSDEDLLARARVHRLWAEGSYGLMGRTPDHVASVFTGFAGSPHVFERGSKEFADNVLNFHAKARDDDQYLSYVIVPPQVDRAKPAHQQPEPFLYAGVSEERDDGVIVRGAQMIGTASILANSIFLSYIVPLQPGDEDYAISCAVPVDAPGVRLYPRRPYADIATSQFDYPLSSQFDETDALVVFHDVFVPWEHIFVYRRIDLCQDQFFETGAHVIANFQSIVRFGAKLDFAAGLARYLTRLHNIDGVPPVQAKLGGEIAAMVTAITAVTEMAAHNPDIREGLAWPSPQHIYAGMSLQRRWVMELLRQMRELAGGAFLAVPSSEQSFFAEDTAHDVERYYQSAGASARDRVRFLKLMWDFVGTEFAGRQAQYEMFYSAAQHVIDIRLFHNFDWDSGLALVERCLAEKPGASELSSGTPS